jgi:hypothetical protein
LYPKHRYVDALNQVVGTQHLIEAKHKIWDQIIEKMNIFRAYFELFQHCEIMVIENAQIEFKKLLPEVEEKDEITK